MGPGGTGVSDFQKGAHANHECVQEVIGSNTNNLDVGLGCIGPGWIADENMPEELFM